MEFSIFDKKILFNGNCIFSGTYRRYFIHYHFLLCNEVFGTFFLPVLAKKVVEKASQQFKQQQENYQNQNTTQNQTNQKPKEKKIVGDYIDFEEIE